MPYAGHGNCLFPVRKSDFPVFALYNAVIGYCHRFSVVVSIGGNLG
jgi:hypothetical protein